MDQDVAEALEHPVAVIVGEGEFGWPGHPHESRHPTLEGAIRPSLGIGGGKKEIRRTLDEGAVVRRKLGARKRFEAVGNEAALELILQPAVSLMIHDAIGHRSSPLVLRLADV